MNDQMNKNIQNYSQERKQDQLETKFILENILNKLNQLKFNQLLVKRESNLSNSKNKPIISMYNIIEATI